MNNDKLKTRLQIAYNELYLREPSQSKSYHRYNLALNLLGDELKSVGGHTRTSLNFKEQLEDYEQR